MALSIIQLDKRKLKKEAEDAKAIAEQERKKRRFPGKHYQIYRLHYKRNAKMFYSFSKSNLQTCQYNSKQILDIPEDEIWEDFLELTDKGIKSSSIDAAGLAALLEQGNDVELTVIFAISSETISN